MARRLPRLTAVAADNPDDVRAAAREILSRPEFADPQDSFWSDAARAVLDPVGSIQKVFEWLLRRTDAETGNPVFAWAIVVIALAVIAFVVVRVTQSMTRDDSVAMPLAPDTGATSWRELLERAERHEAERQWRQAVRLRYAALIGQLADEGVLERRPGRTTGEYARQVRVNAPDAAPSFGAATDIFEVIWYGDGVADEESASSFRRLAEASVRTAVA